MSVKPLRGHDYVRSELRTLTAGRLLEHFESAPQFSELRKFLRDEMMRRLSRQRSRGVKSKQTEVLSSNTNDSTSEIENSALLKRKGLSGGLIPRRPLKENQIGNDSRNN